MRTLVVFFSLDGNTKLIAGLIAEKLNADVFELKMKKAYPASGIMKYFLAGKSALFNERPALAGQSVDLGLYENILIGTPVWAGSYASPVSTFLHQYSIKGKKIALFACHGGGGAEKCFQKLREALAENEFIGETDFVSPLKKERKENAAKAVEWAESLLNENTV